MTNKKPLYIFENNELVVFQPVLFSFLTPPIWNSPQTNSLIITVTSSSPAALRRDRRGVECSQSTFLRELWWFDQTGSCLETPLTRLACICPGSEFTQCAQPFPPAPAWEVRPHVHTELGSKVRGMISSTP